MVQERRKEHHATTDEARERITTLLPITIHPAKPQNRILETNLVHSPCACMVLMFPSLVTVVSEREDVTTRHPSLHAPAASVEPPQKLEESR